MKQIPLAIQPEAEPRFAGFVTGANAAAVQHLRGLDSPAAPVYLWGPAGSGKTHLLRALAAARQDAGERVGGFDARSPLPWTVDEAWSLMLLDDCQDFDPLRQQAAFAAFVDAGTLGVQVVAAGRVPPVDLPVREDLRTRLGWGHVFALQPLGEAEARAALRREADRRGIFLSDEVMDYLLTRFARDLKHLMGLLDRLDTFALAQQRHVTVPLLKAMLAQENP
jgi:DnaA family protein